MAISLAFAILCAAALVILLVCWGSFWMWFANRCFDIVNQTTGHATVFFGGTFSPFIAAFLWAFWVVVNHLLR